MDYKTLLETAREGNTLKLQALLEKDPLLLHRIRNLPLFSETPLHTAALAGKSEFVKQLLKLAPWLATQPSNRHRVNALHTAASIGNVVIVATLLDFNNQLDLMVDFEGCGPLHYAAYYGRSEVVKVLVSRRFSLLKEVNLVGETALHVAVKSNQYDVIKVFEELLIHLGNDEFCEDVMMRMKDENGYSVARLLVASSYKGTQLFQAFVSREICESGVQLNNNNPRLASTGVRPNNQLNVGNEAEKELIQTEEFARQVILVIMTLIATVTFQSLISPPQSLWNDGDPQDSGKCLNFLVSNTTGFLISCWGLLAVLTRRDLNMIYFWLGASIGFLFLSYIYVLLPMILLVNDVRGFIIQLLLMVSVDIILCLALCSNTFKWACAKLKEYWHGDAQVPTTNVTSTSNIAMVPMSSATSGINTRPIFSTTSDI